MTTLKKAKGQAASVFRLRDKVLGEKKLKPEAITIEDPSTGVMIDFPERIREVTLNYCIELLTNRIPREDFKEIVEKKKDLYKERMKEAIHNEEHECISMEDFSKAIEKISEKHKDKYQLILEGGDTLKNAIYNLFKLVWKEEKNLSGWKKSKLVQLWKGSGKKTSHESMRFIHLKEEIPKLFSQIVVEKAKPNIFENITKFLIAGKPCHQPMEHLFVLMSLIALHENNKKSLLIAMYVIQKLFEPKLRTWVYQRPMTISN